MKCPKCHDKDLSPFTTEGVEFDFCSPNGCKGIWCDRGELAYYTETKKDLPSNRLLEEEGSRTALKCPRCEDETLIQISYLKDNKDVFIDTCPACRGIWLDFKELGTIQKLAINIDVEDKLKRTFREIGEKLG